MAESFNRYCILVLNYCMRMENCLNCGCFVRMNYRTRFGSFKSEPHLSLMGKHKCLKHRSVKLKLCFFFLEMNVLVPLLNCNLPFCILYCWLILYYYNSSKECRSTLFDTHWFKLQIGCKNKSKKTTFPRIEWSISY